MKGGEMLLKFKMKRTGFIFDGYIVGMVAVSAALNVVLWYYLKRMAHYGDDAFITLHFTAASGADLIGEAKELHQLPYYAALASIINIALARLLYHYDTLSSYVLVSALPLLNASAFLNGFLLLLVNA